jgi:hypothetical protein
VCNGGEGARTVWFQGDDFHVVRGGLAEITLRATIIMSLLEACTDSEEMEEEEEEENTDEAATTGMLDLGDVFLRNTCMQSRKSGCSGSRPSATASSPIRLELHTDILRIKSLAGTVGSGLGNLMPLNLILKLNIALRDTLTSWSVSVSFTFPHPSKSLTTLILLHRKLHQKAVKERRVNACCSKEERTREGSV